MSTADFGSPVTSYAALMSCNKANQDDRALGGIPETRAAEIDMDVFFMYEEDHEYIHPHKQREPRLCKKIRAINILFAST